MAEIKIFELYPIGYNLFHDFESFLGELTTQDIGSIEGGYFSGLSGGWSGGWSGGLSGGYSGGLSGGYSGGLSGGYSGGRYSKHGYWY
ncbi:hypothetical protein VB735_09795 [Halotia wernerae UHCC 0503]|nr:hypothetical protein [Halotia wernerae UHCC 0503]